MVDHLSQSEIARFWVKVDRRDPDECWPWTACKYRKGYGQFNVQRSGKSVKLPAHRVSFYLTYGHWPTPIGRHTCDNPPCCNPAHILEGTYKDNWADMLARGRRGRGGGRGEDNANAKLTTQDVLDIRLLIRKGLLQKEIAAHYHVSRATIGDIATGRSW